MKRWFCIGAVLIVAVGVGVHETSRAQPGKDGPGDGGAVLRLPGDPAPVNAAPLPYYLQAAPKQAVSPFPAPPPPTTGGRRIALPPSNQVDINRDIEVTPQAGPWMILVMSYAGPAAPKMARDFVYVLRSHYKLNAYVFNYGAEEKRKEFERVQKVRQEQIDALKRENCYNADVPIRVPTMKIDESTGVLIGGYRTFDEATAAAKVIRKLNPEALRGNVDLDVSLITSPTEAGSAKKAARIEVVKDSITFINPFQRAFPCHNPALPKEQAASTAAEDMNFLRKVNSGEPFSLLQCKQPFTLAVKQFVVQHKTLDAGKESDKKAKSFLQGPQWIPLPDLKNFGLGLIRTDKTWEDTTAQSAHNLAEQLRNYKVDAYVLHCRYCSYVTVGGYSSLEDPRLISMQNELERFFKMPPFNHPKLGMFPRPVPMPVPGVGMVASR